MKIKSHIFIVLLILFILSLIIFKLHEESKSHVFVYNSYIYCKTTVNSEMRRELDGAWQPMEGDEYLALEYPVLTDPVYINSLVPHTTRLAGMGGDFDGDTCSCNILYSDEALLEAFVNTNSLKSYVTPSGGLINSANTDTVARILFNMTGHKLA